MTARRGGLTAGGLILAIGLAVVGACSRGDEKPDGVGTASTADESWVTYRDGDLGFSISYPAAWRRAESSLTPNRTEPRELVSVGTDLLEPTPDDMNCAQASSRALEALADTGALISLVEFADADPDGYPPRPPTFTLTGGSPGEAVACVPEPQFTERVFYFRVDDRVFFYAFFLGTNASETTRSQAVTVLNSLEIF